MQIIKNTVHRKLHPTCALLVKAGKSVTDHILRISAIQLLSKHGQKHGKIDWTRRFIHHCLQVLICGVLTYETRVKEDL